jgi:hypothetical protein
MHLLFLLMVAAAAGSKEAGLLLLVAPSLAFGVFEAMERDRLL